jgi:small subunit ribosomal protein S9
MAQDIRTLEDLQSVAGVAPVAEPAAPREPVRDALGRSYATGKRKDAVARVWIKPGSGKVTVNGKEMAVYFARPVLQMILRQPFQIAGVENEFDVMATVAGGGLSGQAGAVKHGISKALQLYDPSLRGAAQGGGLPHPRQPRGGAQEVRPPQGPPQLPVLQALTLSALAAHGPPSGGPFRLDFRPQAAPA